MSKRSTLALLKGFSSCDVSDALLKLGVVSGGYLPDIVQRTRAKQENPLPIVGRAFTVQFAERNSSQKPNFDGHYIDQIPADVQSSHTADEHLPTIPVLAAPPSLTCAILGGIMALRASVQNAAAIVVSGRVRDLAELDSEDSTAAVFSRGLSTVGAGAGSKVVSIGTSCDVTGYGDVNTGDIVMIDGNGIVVIPQSVDMARLVQLMEILTAQDDQVKNSVKAGMTVQAAFERWRK